LNALIDIFEMAVGAVNMMLIVWFIIGLLFAFNVVNHRNEFLFQVYRSIASLFEPVLRPIRRMLPDTGSIDFSPMVLIFILVALERILEAVRPYS
jgi:YggT family protein